MNMNMGDPGSGGNGYMINGLLNQGQREELMKFVGQRRDLKIVWKEVLKEVEEGDTIGSGKEDLERLVEIGEEKDGGVKGEKGLTRKGFERFMRDIQKVSLKPTFAPTCFAGRQRMKKAKASQTMRRLSLSCIPVVTPLY